MPPRATGAKWRFPTDAPRRTGPAMLDMRPDCERCGVDLPADAPGAFICSFECTFCADCADALDDHCPNCGGELLDRPTRTGKALAANPAATTRHHRRSRPA